MTVRNKKLLIAVIFVLAFLVFYINRSYSHIFDYDRSRDLLTFNLQREYVLDNGPGATTIKYAAIGDSLTYGMGTREKESTFPYIVAQNLLKENKKVEVYNLGISGAITKQILEKQVPEAIELQPDFITLMTGTNDVHDYVDKESFRNSLTAIIDRLQSKTKAKILVINIPYLGTDTLILPPHDVIIDARIKEFNQVISEVAAEKNVKLFDLYSKSSTPFKENQKLYYSIDEFHPSGKGYILWGELINGN